MKNSLSRQEALKLGGLALFSLGFNLLKKRVNPQVDEDVYRPVFMRSPEYDLGTLARVASKQVDIRSRPNDEAPIVGNRFRDQIIHIYGSIRPDDAPIFYNTLWYRVWGGYVHSAHLQIVEQRLNEPEFYVPEAGRLCEVTVPYTEAYQYNSWEGWIPWRGSRLYYSSTHWATGIDEGPDGRAWYQVTSELSKTEKYMVPAEHLRIIPRSEYTPISTHVPPEQKRIEISIKEQLVRAFEGDEEVFKAKISSGLPSYLLTEDDLPTETPEGRFNIYSKMPSKHMGSVAGGPEVEENGGFTLPGVPWTCFFKSPGGYALHGTYWHNNFGLQMSHGCVNMNNDDAKWLFRWTTPVFDPYEINSPADWERTGNGTQVYAYS